MPLSDIVRKQLTESKYIPVLDLSETDANDNDMDELVRSIQQNNVKIGTLKLYRTNIRSAGAKFLAQIASENVNLLRASYCSIGKEGAIALIRSGIKQIDISDNGFREPEEVADIFLREGKQTYINLHRNGISDKKMQDVDNKMEQNKRESETPKYSSPTPSLASTSFYTQPAKSTSSQTEILPTIEISIEGHQVNISSAEAEKLVLYIMENLLQQSSASDKQFLQKLQTLKDRIEQSALAGANKIQPSH